MADSEMVWDEASGKLVPKSGFRKESGPAKTDGRAAEKRTRRMADRATNGDRPEHAAPHAQGERAETPSPDVRADDDGARAADPRAGEMPDRKVPDEQSGGRSLGTAPKRVARGRDEKTVAHGAGEEDWETAGWLAFLDRSVKGGYSVVRPGQNSIGRGPDNHIVIEGERTVTREAAAFIIVDPDDRSVHLRPGIGRSIVRINDKLVADTQSVSPGDRIQIGKVTCMYVPFPWDAAPDDDADGDA